MTGRRILTGNFNQKCASCQHRAWKRKNRADYGRRVAGRLARSGVTVFWMVVGWLCMDAVRWALR